MKAKSVSFDPPSAGIEAIDLTDTPSSATDVQLSASATASSQRGVSFSSTRQVFQFRSTHPNQGDNEKQLPHAMMDEDFPPLSPRDHNDKPPASPHTSDPIPLSTQEELEVYADLMEYLDKITWI